MRHEFLSLINFGGACWEWRGYRDQFGYGRIRFLGHIRRAHRLIWEYANGPIPRGLFILHRCDNPPCVRPSHLYVGTLRDNARDVMMRNRRPTKLRPDQIPLIRRDRELGLTQLQIADRYGVSQTTIWAILAGKTWAYATDTPSGAL